MHQIQKILLEWKQKFTQQQINYDEILIYASYQSQLKHLGQVVCASSAIMDTQDTLAMKNMFLDAFEQLNILLIKYIPGQPDAKWCTLPSLLQGWGVVIPQHLLDTLSQHVVFPGEKEIAGLLDNHLSASTNEIFQPGHDESLKLSKAFSLHMLIDFVEEMKAFLQPIMDVLNILIFFKLHPSRIFDKYVQVCLKKESELGTREQCSALASSFTAPASPVTSMQSKTESQHVEEGLPLHVLQRAVIYAHKLIVKLVQGTATYSEITTEGELNVEKLDIEREFSVVHSFLAYLELSVHSYQRLTGSRNMLELFQYVHYIRTIHNVCEQYQLQECLEDPHLVELCQLAENLDLEENCTKLTPFDASEKMDWVRKKLFLGNKTSPQCLKLFTAVSDSAAFYQFVRNKWFVGENGQAVFQQQYQLITAQLQHDEYDETVLNHLYAAFKIIEPFMDTRQTFQQLMSHVKSLDVTDGLKQLETVNSNITLIQLWFSRAEVSTHFHFTRHYRTNTRFLPLLPLLSARVIHLRMWLRNWTALLRLDTTFSMQVAVEQSSC